MNPNLVSMATFRQAHYSSEEFADRGNKLYNERIRPNLEAASHGKFVAIDIETALWEIDSDPLAACDRLIAKKPESQLWLVRVGYPYLHRIGGPRRPVEQ